MRFDEINIIGEFKINGLTGSPGQALGLSGSDFTWITVSASSVIDAVGLTGTDYVICQSVNTGNPGADAIENGNRLKSAYATASALYVSNRVSVLITPGDYNFDATPLQLTTTKVDLIGISSDASDVILRGSGDYVLQIVNSNTDTALCNVTLGTASLYAFDNSGTSSCYLRWDNVIATGNMFTDDNLSYSDLNGDFKNIKVYNSDYAFSTLNGDINGVYNKIELIGTINSFFSSDNNILGTYSNISGTTDLLFRCGGSINGTFENIKIGDVADIFYADGISGNFRDIEVGDVTEYIFYSDSSLDGTFENIKIGNVTIGAFVTTSANLSGTFSNIEIGDCTDIFKTNTSGSIIGQFKDITIGTVSSGVFYSFTNISGNFENIKIGDCVGPVLYSGGATDGTFNNIKSGNSDNLFITNNGLSGTFSNIKFGNANAFHSSSSINGYFENISGGNLGNLGAFNSEQEMKGYYKNITLVDSPDENVFRSGKIDGIYDQIKAGEVRSSFFYCNGGTMSGTFSNIEVGNVVGNTFYSDQSLIGTYENIKIGTCSNAFISNGSDINGYFDTIEIGDVSNSSFVPSSNLLGTYKNISISSGSGASLFLSTNTNGIFDNIKAINSDTISNFFYSSDVLYGTFSNIEANGQITNAFSADSTVDGQYKNLTLGTVSILFNSVVLIGVPAVIDNLKANSYLNNFSGKITNSTIDSSGLSASAISITDTLGTPIIERCKFLSDSSVLSINSGGPINAQISFTITNYGITSSITNDISTPLNINNSNIT
jgi:hypothetical protein